MKTISLAAEVLLPVSYLHGAIDNTGNALKFSDLQEPLGVVGTVGLPTGCPSLASYVIPRGLPEPEMVQELNISGLADQNNF